FQVAAASRAFQVAAASRAFQVAARSRALPFDQPLLAPQSTAVPVEGSIRADDAVARDDDGNGISSIRVADRADRGRPAHSGGELAIGGPRAVGQAREAPPDGALKRSAAEVERGLEATKLPAEIGVELPAKPLDVRIRSRNDGRMDPGRGPGPSRGELEEADALRACDREHGAEGR